MAIDDMIACHFVDPDFQVEIFSEKEEVGRWGGGEWGFRETSCKACLLSAFLLTFLVANKNNLALKSSLDFYFYVLI